MTLFRSLVPNAEAVVAMHPSDLAGYILEVLLGGNNPSLWHRSNFCMYAGAEFVDSHGNSHQEVAVACSAAWSWLEANGLICPKPTDSGGWFVPTRLANDVRNSTGLRKLVSNQALPEDFLHPAVISNARPLFLQSRFDTAVFEAFKALEVTIRTAAGLGHEMIGTNLASRAFNPESGELTDSAAEKGERVALMNLMTGALGSYKNPSSHRHVELTATEAREMIILASHLLKIVDSRAANRK